MRGSFRLAPLISAIGMSIVLQNFAQVSQGAGVKPIAPLMPGGYELFTQDGFAVQLSWMQIAIIVTTLIVLGVFTWLVTRTPLGRAMRACEQDLKMAGLLGIDIDRIISLTFVIGAALAAVAGCMFLLTYGVIDFFIGFLAGVKAFTAAVLGGIGSLPGAVLGGLLIGLIETFWSAYFSVEYKDVAAFGVLIVVLIFMPTGLLGRAGRGEGMIPALRHAGLIAAAGRGWGCSSRWSGCRRESGPSALVLDWRPGLVADRWWPRCSCGPGCCCRLGRADPAGGGAGEPRAVAVAARARRGAWRRCCWPSRCCCRALPGATTSTLACSC